VPIVSQGLGLTDSDREEVLQEMTLIAYRSIGNLREPERLASWTYTIARRAAILQMRARRARGESGRDGEGAESPLDRLPSDDLPVDEVLATWDDGRRLRSAVAELKPACRRLIEDLYFREPRSSYKDVSAERGIPVGSIGPTLARCLETLRRIWKTVSRGARRPSALT
jgi:RNA polymerase sigma factor (sigma-70 family)